MLIELASKNIRIEAPEICLGENTSFGHNIDIKVRGVFKLGGHSRLGDDVFIRANNAVFGQHLYHSRGLRVGGGGYTNPTANLTIGDRCTIHNNYLNIAEPIKIGDDVGLSLDVSIQTHGYWLSVFEGFPAKFAGVRIGRGTIVGYRTTILPGVTIGEEVVIGACSVVTKNLPDRQIYVGNPARPIKGIRPLSPEQSELMLAQIAHIYTSIAEHHGLNNLHCTATFPFLTITCGSRKWVVNVVDQEIVNHSSPEDEVSDHFRDYLRKWGIRIYTDRPFRSIINQ